MIKPEHLKDCEFIVQSIFRHELSTMKVYHEPDLVKKYYQIKQKIEKVYDGIDINKLLASGLY